MFFSNELDMNQNDDSIKTITLSKLVNYLFLFPYFWKINLS